MAPPAAGGAAPDTWLVVLTAVPALFAVASRRAWRVLRHVVTITHEGGHALAAVATGRRLRGVRLHSDTSGLTVSSGAAHGPGMVVTALSGYVAPSLIGLAAAGAVAHGYAAGTLVAFVVLLGLLLTTVRNAFGWLTVVLTGAACAGAAAYGSPTMRWAAASTITWFLLVAGPRPVLELQRARRAGRARTSDADQLARLTRLPGLFWVAFFAVATVSAAALGAWSLLKVA